jgi:hypothetical protein
LNLDLAVEPGGVRADGVREFLGALRPLARTIPNWLQRLFVQLRRNTVSRFFDGFRFFDC